MKDRLHQAIRGILIAGGLGAAHAAIGAAGEQLDGAGTGEWIGPREPITIAASRLEAVNGRYAIFIGSNDVTALFRRTRSDSLRYASDLMPLPEGENDLVVYDVSAAGDWQEIYREPLRVTTTGGFETASWQPRLDLNEESLVDEGSNDSTAIGLDSSAHDFALQGGLTSRHVRGEREVRTSWNVVGSSAVEAALRFGALGDAAPRIDLSDFLIDYEIGPSTFSLGHVNFGNQSLLVNGLANRGLGYAFGGERFDVALTAQNGQRIVGYDNLLGLDDGDNRVVAISSGIELRPERPGAARLELSLVDALTQSLLDFNTGQVPDAEQNSGGALRFSAMTRSGRVRTTMNVARSRYTNPTDPFLEQGLDLVPVRETVSSARNAEVNLVLVESKPETQGAPMTMVATLRHEFADALYRAFGASVAPGLTTNSLGLDGSIGQAAFAVLTSRAEDNPDDIPTILKTRTDNAAFNLSLPLQSMLAGGGSVRPWLPQMLSHNIQLTDQLGINRPPSFDPLTHIPDQRTDNRNLSLSWALGRIDITLQHSRSTQDNRQPGRANADFENLSHGVNFGFRPLDRLGLNLGASSVEAINFELDLVQDTWSYTFGFDWQVSRNLSLRGNYSLVDVEDSQGFVENRSYTTQTELNWRFQVPIRPFRRLPGQFFLRHALLGANAIDNQFGFVSDTRRWTLNAGFSISFF